MAYALNNSAHMANGSKSTPSSGLNDSNEQRARLQEQNHTLQRKLHNKTTENQRLTTKLEKLENELESYKLLLQRINQNLSNGEQVPCKLHKNFVLYKQNADFKHRNFKLETNLFVIKLKLKFNLNLFIFSDWKFVASYHDGISKSFQVKKSYWQKI